MDITDIVNDKYWLGYAKKNIDGAEADLKDAASTLNKLVATFWGIYTAAFTAGSIAGKVKVDNCVQLILFILPIPLLIAAYLVTTFAQLPGFKTEDVDPRIPDDVRKYYNKNIKDKTSTLKLTFALIAASALSLTVALVLLNAKSAAPGTTAVQQSTTHPVDKKHP